MKYIRSKIYLLFFIASILLLGSCNVSKFLNSDQYLVKKNKVIFDDPKLSKDDPNLIYNLESFILQKPNTNHLATPREWLYFKNKEQFEQPGKKKGRVKEAQLPVLHEDDLMFQTAEKMEKYLRFSKGFYNARVYPKAYLGSKKAEIHYHVTTEKRYTIRSKEYFCEDEAILQAIQSIEEKTLVKEGANVDESVFDAEKTRLFGFLQDKGYANFAKNNIDFKADSSDYQMDIFIRIVPPPSDSIHRKYSIGKITVYPDYKGTIGDNTPFFREFKGKNYAFTSGDYFVKPSTLNRSIQLSEGSQFRKTSIDNTYSSLANLGTYRFINIASSISEENDTIVNYNIFLTPIENVWATDASLNLFYTFLSQRAQSRIGLSAITSLTNINTFGGGEKFSITGELTGEVQLPDWRANTNFTAQIEAALSYPVLVDYKNITSRILGVFWDEDESIKIRNSTKTNLALGYSYNQLIDQYRANNINADISFDHRPNTKFQYLWTVFNVNSLSTFIEPDFERIVSQSPLFKLSFDKRFITSFAIPFLSYKMNSPLFSSGFKWSIQVTTEKSGLEVLLANAGYNLITGNNDEWAINLGPGNIFKFSKFALADVNIAATQIISNEHSISGRFRAGAAVPFLKDGVIPFVRQFYVGGANSLRAWQTRGLGPGAYIDYINTNILFQSGDIALEANLEYRFPVYSYLKGGVFIDAGNVWTLYEDIGREGTQFKFNTFYNQIAIGYGYGVRLDLDFLVIRLDLGYKLRFPFLRENSHWNIPVATEIFNRDFFIKPNYTLGLNYPF